MTVELEKRYNPAEVEDKIYAMWEKEGSFASTPHPEKEPYTIVIPPPNVTGALHMGHALNNTIQDILIRYRRMQGYEALWLPGTDHAGIATQNVVEKELLKEKKSRHDLGRDKFVERVWDWKAEYGSRIINQLKKLGSSCDWDRGRFTMDEGLSQAVKENFVKLYKKGLVYKGFYLVNWCPKCHTALSDDEIEHEDKNGHLWYMKYPVKGEDAFITVATTRPETMLGDTAVAVNPTDERYAAYIGKSIVLPFINREIPILADEHVDASFGTGAVKVTPAHDPNDFAIGKRHNLEEISIMDGNAVMNEHAGEFQGQDRFTCRKNILAGLKDLDLLEKTEDHSHSVGHCYRCNTTMEFHLSDQWFVKMKPLAERALAASDKGEVTFHPDRWDKVYRSWLENVRDWCISRQIWWGHRIPIWYCQSCDEIIPSAEDTVTTCPACNSTELEQDPDVLDTWFSSALWPFSTLGWPENTEDLNYYYPTNTLVTDRGIIYFWVARMVMMGLANLDKVPFSDVYIHGTILDETGRKMSKSLGNGIDPLEMIKDYSADAVRFSLIMLTTEGQDVKLAPTKFEMGRNFTNKLFNAARFTFMNLEGFTPGKLTKDDLTFEDRWILTCLHDTEDKITTALDKFHFNEALNAIYHFVWHQFCDWYLELIKPAMSEGGARREKTQRVLTFVLDNVLRMLHPFVPFITEELWDKLNELSTQRNPFADNQEEPRLITAAWTKTDVIPHDSSLAETMNFLQDVVRAVRNIRSSRGAPERKDLSVIINLNHDQDVTTIKEHESFISRMAHCTVKAISTSDETPDESAVEVIDKGKVFVLLEGLIDKAAETAKLEKQKADIEKAIIGVEKKLENENFTSRAPAEVVQSERDRLGEFNEKLTNIEKSITALK